MASVINSTPVDLYAPEGAAGSVNVTDISGGIKLASPIVAVKPNGDIVEFATNDKLDAIKASTDLLATQSTLAALKTVTDTLLTATQAILSSIGTINTNIASLNTKTTAVNTGSIAGTVELGATSLNALETISTNGLTDTQLRASPLPVNGTIALDSNTLAALENTTISGTVALDAPTLAALETINTGGLTDAQLRASALNVTVSNPTSNITGYATESTQAQVKSVLDTIAAKPDAPSTVAISNQITGYATETTLYSINGKLPALSGGRLPVELPAGSSGLTDTELRASPLQTINADLVSINDTLLTYLSAIFEKMPRIQANDRLVCDMSETSLGTITTLTTANDLLRLQNLGVNDTKVTKATDAIPMHLSNIGALHLYDKIIVS